MVNPNAYMYMIVSASNPEQVVQLMATASLDAWEPVGSIKQYNNRDVAPNYYMQVMGKKVPVVQLLSVGYAELYYMWVGRRNVHFFRK